MFRFLRLIYQFWQKIVDTNSFWRNRNARIAAYSVGGLALALALFAFFDSAPPSTLTISTGPQGSLFQRTAEKYRKHLEKNGVKLVVLSSSGSIENLKRLNDPKFKVDVAFVQGGVAKDTDVSRLMSLGSVAYEPMMIFYRSKEPALLLSDFKGKRLIIGPEGSGAHQLALELLKWNGIERSGPTELLPMESEEAMTALLDGKADAIFFMSDSASNTVVRKLLREPGVRLYDFAQATAYTRRIHYLNKLVLPRGSIEFGRDIPAADLTLVGPTVELVARESLHPALSDLLLEAGKEVHGRATLLQKAGEFPAPLEHEFPISEEAARYYKSGKTFLYRQMPYWLASLADRVVWAIIPLLVILIPGMRIIPALYAWHMRSRILRWYGSLLALEKEILEDLSGQNRQSLRLRLDTIERGVLQLKVPTAFGDQFYVLREHINFVRHALDAPFQPAEPDHQPEEKIS